MWRAYNGKIPTARALAARSVAFGDGLRPLCDIHNENVDHLLAAYSFTRTVYWLVCVWVIILILYSFNPGLTSNW
ncbi:hypothetical protein HanIR_Chr03g0143391 [Helianthus annuus]|nr:hypothetical protein HanIR_Chr03g0143391 [Helianthus annuus]